MHEICLSGSEGGAKPTFVPTPISARRFNAGRFEPYRLRPILEDKEALFLLLVFRPFL